MPKRRDTLLIIRVIDGTGRLLNANVDIDIRHSRLTERLLQRRVDASREIEIRGLRRAKNGDYRVTVTPQVESLASQSQMVSIPADGVANAQFVFGTVSATVPPTVPPEELYVVTGTISSPDRAGVARLIVRVVDKNVGGDVTLAQVVTDDRGRYTAQFPARLLQERKKLLPDLQARVFQGEVFLGASEVRFDAGREEVLNVLLPPNLAAVSTEHEALTGAVRTHFAGNLRDLQETDEKQDITYLANKSGWDARAVAMAALGDQFSQFRANVPGAPAGQGIHPAFYYALFRAGLPANPDTLYHTDTATVARVWKQSIEQGVIPKELEAQAPQAAQVFQALSADKLLTTPAPLAVSPLQEMLATSRLDAGQQQQFAALYTQNRDDLPKFWSAVGEQLGEETAERLQVDGKIAFLTLNNAPLMEQVRGIGGEAGITDPVQLAQAGFYRASSWGEILGGDIPVPDRIPGENDEVKRANYADYLAAQVRLSYPTAAIAHMVQSGNLPVNSPGQVNAFLSEHNSTFEIGVQPVEQFIAKNNLEVAAETVAEVKRVQRLYQITPNDQAMSALITRGVDSAYQVMRHEKDAFIATFAEELGGADSALQIYNKSAQVYNAVLNVTISYLAAKNGIQLGAQPLAANPPGNGGGLVLQPAPTGPTAENAADVIAYPTLEGLFGSMDFCTCEECRSILSPAAYLVDLLNFIDQSNPPGPTENPQTVLLERRPDLQHLPLTCENTNTALPYIDVVNETLEYFISNGIDKFTLNGYIGHDTNNALSADLLASPQFVMEAAYTTLLTQRFPMPLPFHRALESMRRHFEKFEVPLPLAMERLRVTDGLERGGKPYGWRDILMEEARISRAEYRIFTDSGGTPLWRLYGFPNGTTDETAIAGLSNAKQFARRLSISYEDVASILRTRFINPDGDLIPKLERLGVPFATLAALKAGTITGDEFDALLPTGSGAPDPAAYAGDIKAWVTNDANFARIMGLITLTDPAGGLDPCNFDALEFRHAQPTTGPDDTSTRLTAAEFTRILRFIRLWKKLQWNIEQTDAAICALYRQDLAPLQTADVDSVADLDAGFLILLPRVGIVLRVMRVLNLTVSRDLSSLLACWSPLGTHGPNALYRQMFLNPALIAQDAAFDDNGFGEFLQDNTQKLFDHSAALRSAFTLTAEEFERISAALGFDAETVLNLENISAVYRRTWLARKLALSVRELLLLIQLTGLDPFSPPDPTNPAIMRIIDLVRSFKDRSLKSAVALYLIWNHDLSGVSAPAPEQIRELARLLRADFAAIDDQFALTDDPSGDIARARMALVYGTEATTAFFDLLDDTTVVDVSYTHPQPKLKPAILNAAPKIGYDAFRHRLSHIGLLTPALRDALKAVPAVPAAFQDAVDELFERGEDIKGSFFGRYPELKPLYDDYVASNAPVEEKRQALLAAFRPELSRRRKREQALQRLSAAFGVDIVFTRTIVDPAVGPFPLHARERPNRSALTDVLAVESGGLAAQFFFRNTATGNIDMEESAAELNYSDTPGHRLPAHPNPARAISGIWRGYLETPEAGFFNFIIEADQGANVKLRFNDQIQPLTQNGKLWRNTDPLELQAGTLYEVVVTVEKVKEKLSVSWETPVRSREVIPGRYLYSRPVLGPFSDLYIRFLKTASLAAALKLTPAEMAHFATHPDYRVNSDEWLNILPVTESADAPTSAALLKPLEALLTFCRIRAEMSPDDESLLQILKDPPTATATADSLLFTLTRWDPKSLTDLLSRFGDAIADLSHLEVFRRVYDAFALIQTMGISASALIAATTNEPTSDMLGNFQAALRARYDPADWRDVVKPINDAMRGLQRNALVAFILHRLRSNTESAHIDTVDKLFEYFLMDVAMEPCMLTSRIRHALSSVQLFIERCLMNLEPRVSPAAINAKQWEWMKRYRVWEANRKVFLFPENWLEPELRDNKSPFFKEIESELVQSDITEDTATVAILNYLSKLEEVSKLQPCGIYHVEANPELRTGVIDHVVARTPGAQRKYYYRRREGVTWTPWEQIKLEIEDNPVIPVMWDGRLLLFWLKLVKESPENPDTPGGSGAITGLTRDELRREPKVRTKGVLAFSEYYNGKWQPAKTSDVALPSLIREAAEKEGLAIVRRDLRLSVSEKNDKLRIAIDYQGSERTSFILYNTHSSPVRKEDQVTSEQFASDLSELRLVNSLDGDLAISYYSFPDFGAGYQVYIVVVPHVVLKPEAPFDVVEPLHPLEKPFEAPFFINDRRNAFFVTAKPEPVWIQDYPDFGITPNPGPKIEPVIPPLVLELPPIHVGPQFWGDGGPIGPDPAMVDVNPIQQFVTEDIYINQGIGSAGPVVFNGRPIGPSGSIQINQNIANTRKR